MKKIFFTLILIFTAYLSHAQILYGTAADGGLYDGGTICVLDASTNTLTAAFSFIAGDGSHPMSGLVQASDGRLYGMTNYGGSSGFGVIFSFEPSTANYARRINFNGTNGKNPYGGLVQASDGKLYGMTTFGGSNDLGVIFSFDPANATYAKLRDFDGANGAHPYGSLVQASDGKLYGTASQGGSINMGIFFSYDPATATIAILQDFNGTNGAHPYGGLVQASDGKLYGTAAGAAGEPGGNGYGIIFSYDPATASYGKLYDFDFTNGARPGGTLMQASNGKLYGMTAEGGIDPGVDICGHGLGVIFSYDPATASYDKLYDFDFTNGANPASSLMQASDGKLYGMTFCGGSDLSGVSFSFDPVTNTYMKLADFINHNIYMGASPSSSFIELCPTWFRDADGDGFGDVNNPITSCSIPPGYVGNGTDCNDDDANEHSLVTYYKDDDNDGFGDPGNAIIACSSTPPSGCVSDNSDCDDTKLLYVDTDGDGFGVGSPVACGVANNTDCNDNNASVHGPITYYKDNDNDGYGDPDNTITTCQRRPAGYVTNHRDCNDNNAAMHPGTAEICGNGIDDNCNGRVDEGCLPVLITIYDRTVVERNKGTTSWKVTVKLSKKSGETITVNYTTLDITTIAGSDYIPQSGTLTFEPGVRNNVITIQVVGDKVQEADKTFEILLSNPVHADISNDIGIITLLDNDGLVASKPIVQDQGVGSAGLKDIKLSPNPANGKVNLVLTGFSGSVVIQLMDMNGKLLQEKKVTGISKLSQQQINISNYPNGVYLVSVMDEKGNRKIEKLIISR